MDVLRVFYLFYLGAAFIKCTPVKKHTLYDAIEHKCPAVKTLLSFKDQKLFHICDDWERISKTNILTENTKNDVLCLLYFESFTQYCSRTIELNITLTSVSPTVTIEAICDNLEIIPKHTEPESALGKIIKNVDDCKNLCSDSYDLVVSVCSISYYLAHKIEILPTKTNSHLIAVHKEPKTNQIPTSTQIKVEESAEPALKQPNGEVGQETTVKAVQAQVPSGKIHPSEGESKDNTKISEQIPVNTLKKVQTVGQSDTSNAVASTINKNEKKNMVPELSENMEKPAAVATQPPPPPQPQPQPPNKDIIEENKDNQLAKIPVQEQNPEEDFTDDQEFGHNEENLPPNNGPVGSEEDLGDTQNFNEKPKSDTNKPQQTDETEAANYTTEMDGDSYFFTYFMLLCVIFIVGYVCYHNKQKILALILEGRRGKRQYRGRRPNSANYHKLDSNLEEAITSSCNKNTNNVIY